jgi:VIT1/CCC1 family predicted Fe2+/Mn2+ transporter
MSEAPESTSTRRARVLDPVDRASEIVFGLLMALSFTGSLSVASAGREEVRTMMAAALGCNLAWGLADAVMYLVGIVVERARAAKLAGAPVASGLRLLRRDDYVGGLGVFLMVVLATFPVVIPFAVFDDTARALRISNLVALATLFAAGWMLGRYGGLNAWRAGAIMAALGAVLVAAIMALGG